MLTVPCFTLWLALLWWCLGLSRAITRHAIAATMQLPLLRHFLPANRLLRLGGTLVGAAFLLLDKREETCPALLVLAAVLPLLPAMVLALFPLPVLLPPPPFFCSASHSNLALSFSESRNDWYSSFSCAFLGSPGAARLRPGRLAGI